MKAMTKKFSVLAALLVAFAVGACDNAQDPTSVQQPETASYSMLEMGMQSVQKDAGGNYYVLNWAKSYPADTLVTAVLDKRGGQLKLGDFVFLDIARNAVTEPTTFSMRLIRDGFVEVELSATREIDGQIVDVGAQGFGARVKLRFNYDYAWVLDANRLVVLWEVNGTRTGSLQAVQSALERKGNWLSADLDHFSTYVMASN